jgi:hypothetical protein
MQHAFPIGDPATAFFWQTEVAEHGEAAFCGLHAAHDALQILAKATGGLSASDGDGWSGAGAGGGHVSASPMQRHGDHSSRFKLEMR